MCNKLLYYIVLVCLLVSCRQAELEYADFELFHPLKVSESNIFEDDGSLNSEIMFPENPSIIDGTQSPMRIASTTAVSFVRNLLGTVRYNKVVQIAGTYMGHDIDGSPLLQSGKIVIPKSGKIKNLVIVSHFTIGSTEEAPSECFPLEAMLASKGYAMVFADYIGFGVTSHRIHPYLHAESTARSVVDLAIAAKGYLEYIGRQAEEKEVILLGYSQGGAVTLSVMRMLQREYAGLFPIKQVYAGAGPYDLTATYDKSVEDDLTGIPCAIPMIIQGINEGERLNLDLADFFQPYLWAYYNEWINSKFYTVHDINVLIGVKRLSDLMTEFGRDKQNPQTAKLYKALMYNSVLDFEPKAPLLLFHSTVDDTVPFVNSQKAENYFKGKNIRYDFGDYGNHTNGFLKFMGVVSKDLD